MRIDQLPFKHDYFWSYIPNADLPAEIIAEKVLIYGDFEDMVRLEKIFGKKFVAKTWRKYLKGKPAYKKLNTVLELLYG